MTERTVCVSCSHEIDAAAKLCPYCGADPRTGAKVDTQALLEEEFRPHHVTASASVLEYARQRQGVLLTAVVIVVLLALAALHQFITRRNETATSSSPAVALTEVTDLSSQPDESKPQPLPDLQFQYDGHPEKLRTFITEPGAVTPPEVVAAQQPQQPQQQQAAVAQPQTPQAQNPTPSMRSVPAQPQPHR